MDEAASTLRLLDLLVTYSKAMNTGTSGGGRARG
ncbi:hypothetical protein B0G76_4335 [Paraburkholderia sp. BL23I1N1]|nr:hypothetical protein B0G76_4335 [Paraburkholderia sp. BL23I1N1]